MRRSRTPFGWRTPPDSSPPRMPEVSNFFLHIQWPRAFSFDAASHSGDLPRNQLEHYTSRQNLNSSCTTSCSWTGSCSCGSGVVQKHESEQDLLNNEKKSKITCQSTALILIASLANSASVILWSCVLVEEQLEQSAVLVTHPGKKVNFVEHMGSF